MGSKGSQTVTQSGNQNQQYTANQPILGMSNTAGQMATTAAGAPFQQPTAPVAPFTPFQSIGFGETLGLQGMAQPYFNTAGNYLAGSAAPITGSDVQNYYNPMASNVTAQLQNIFGQQNVQNTGNLVNAAGGVGADRVAVGQANMANQQTLAAGQVYSQLYQQALQAAEQNKQMQAGAGFAFGQMGPAAQAAQQNAVNQLLGVGAQQQGLNQQQLNAIYQNQLARIAYPFQTAQYLSGITAGLAPAVGGQTQGSYSGQTTYPSPSPFAQALGVGTGLLGMFGGMGGMGAMGLGAAGQMPFGSAMQYLPGGSAYGATPSFQNGAYYPMFDEGGAVDNNYGDLAKRERYQEYAPEISAAAKGNPVAETFMHDVGYDDGGPVIKVGDVVPFDQHYMPNITLREALERSKNRSMPGAQGFAGAPQDAVERAQQSGVLQIHPLHGFDDGGQVDPTIGQAAPMSLNIDPTNAGLPFPGAGRVSGSPVPRTQFTGQPGKSGPFGQYMYDLGLHRPSMPSGGGQSPMSGMGNLGGQLGQLGGSLGKMLGGFGGGSGAAAGAGAAADAGVSAADWTAAGLDLMALADGGKIDDFPTIGPGNVPMAPPTPMPRPYPGERGMIIRPGRSHMMSPTIGPNKWDVLTSAGGAVGHPNRHWDYLRPMAPETFQEGGDTEITTGNESAWGNPFPMMGEGARQIGRYIGDKWNTMTAPAAPPVIPPEAQSQYPSEGHPNLQDQDRPFENVPSNDEAAAYGPGVGRRVGPAETLSDPTGRAPAVIQRTGPGEAARGPYEDVPLDPFGHGRQAAPGAQGAMGVPQTPGTVSFRGQEYDLNRLQQATKRWESGGDYGNVTTTRNRHGMTQRALGAYGIMDFNLNDPNDDWGKQALGRHITPQELLAHPEYQDAIYNYKMGQYIQRYGLEGAGRVWLGGEGSINAPDASDPLGTRVGDYGRKFVQYYNEAKPGGGTAQGIMTSGMRPSDNVEDNRQGAMGSPMAQRNVPFPGAADPNNFARRMTGSPWMALVNAGAQMAQTRGPIGSVIGAGLGAAGKTFEGQRAELNTEQALNDKAEQLLLMADAHLRRYTQMTPSEQATHEETRRYHDIIAGLRGSTLWNSERAKLESEPTWVGRGEEEKDVEVARRITEGKKQGQAKIPEGSVPGTKGGVRGYQTPDGTFVPAES